MKQYRVFIFGYPCNRKIHHFQLLEGLLSTLLLPKAGATDPYQELAALGAEIHRAIRLVHDVSLHTDKMTREDAIHYMMGHEVRSEQSATAEVERYMALPGQALSYKIGELKIKELRDKYERQLGSKFSLEGFHNAILMGGSMPLDEFEKYMDNWVMRQ